MVDVKIESVNQLYARLHCDSGIGLELAEEFSFLVPGAKYMPAVKSGRWDGVIRLFDRRNHQIYRGLLPKVIGWLTNSGYTFEFVNKEALRPQIPYEPNWVADNWSRLGKFEPFEHQVMVIESGLKLNQACLLSPTSSGKSYAIFLMTRYILEHNVPGKVLIITPRVALVEQLYTDFISYEVDPWTEEHVHRISSGIEKNTDKPVVISTWQSIFRQPPTWFSQFGSVIVDEAHEADAASITGIIDKMPNCPIRIGLTGSLDGTLMHEYEIEGRFGPMVKVVTSKVLMEKNIISQLDVRAALIKYPEEDCKTVRGFDYQDEVDFIISNKQRNQFLVDLALDLDGNTLMLFNFISKHGKMILELLQQKAEEKGKVLYYIDGSVHVDEREKIRALLETKNNCILLATYGTLSTGTNIRNLHNTIFCHPYKAQTKILQSIGRVLRKAAGKKKARLFDIGDDLTYISKRGAERVNMTMRHFLSRLQIYDKEGFEYKLTNVSFKH